MRRVLALAAVAVGMFAASAVPAHASTGWPATCRTMRCVNSHLNNLDQRQQASRSRLSALQAQVSDLENTVQRQASKLSCITSLKMWQQYGYDYGGNFFTYMDLTRDYGTGTYNGPFYALQDTCGVF